MIYVNERRSLAESQTLASKAKEKQEKQTRNREPKTKRPRKS